MNYLAKGMKKKKKNTNSIRNKKKILTLLKCSGCYNNNYCKRAPLVDVKINGLKLRDKHNI